MTWLNRVAAVALSVLLAAGCAESKSPSSAGGGSSGPSTTSPSASIMAARGVETARVDIPWQQVGPGWLLATWSLAPGRGSGEPPPDQPTAGSVPTTLYLVDPVGGRYPIVSFPPSGAGPGVTLADWSGDGAYALLYATTPGSPGALTITTVELRTGRQASFTVDKGVSVVPHFSRPRGKAVVLSKGHDTEPASLTRVDLAGKPELTYPVGRDFEGSYLSTPDGTQLVLGTATGLVLMGNDGTTGTTLPITGAQDCAPARWWDAASSVVVARCRGRGPAQLWLVPVGGQSATALTAPLTGSGPDLGDLDAWQLPSGMFVQVAGPCGSEYLGTLSAVGGTTARVEVPGVDPRSSIRVVGPSGSHLVVQGRSACGGGQALVDFDPAATTSTVLLGPPLNGGGVIAAVPYPGRT